MCEIRKDQNTGCQWWPLIFKFSSQWKFLVTTAGFFFLFVFAYTNSVTQSYTKLHWQHTVYKQTHRHTFMGLSHFQNQNCQFLTLAGLAVLVHMVGYSTLAATVEQGNHEMGTQLQQGKTQCWKGVSSAQSHFVPRSMVSSIGARCGLALARCAASASLCCLQNKSHCWNMRTSLSQACQVQWEQIIVPLFSAATHGLTGVADTCWEYLTRAVKNTPRSQLRNSLPDQSTHQYNTYLYPSRLF